MPHKIFIKFSKFVWLCCSRKQCRGWKCNGKLRLYLVLREMISAASPCSLDGCAFYPMPSSNSFLHRPQNRGGHLPNLGSARKGFSKGGSCSWKLWGSIRDGKLCWYTLKYGRAANIRHWWRGKQEPCGRSWVTLMVECGGKYPATLSRPLEPPWALSSPLAPAFVRFYPVTVLLLELPWANSQPFYASNSLNVKWR